MEGWHRRHANIQNEETTNSGLTFRPFLHSAAIAGADSLRLPDVTTMGAILPCMAASQVNLLRDDHGYLIPHFLREQAGRSFHQLFVRHM